MNLGRLKTELKSILREPTVESSFTDWLNDCILELAGQFEIPSLRLQTPATIATTTATYLYDLPAMVHANPLYHYMKRVVRVASPTLQQGFLIEPNVTIFDDIDPNHTDTGASVQRIAVEYHTLATYPKANDTLSLWCYRKPLLLATDTDVPEIPDEEFHYSVLMPLVVLRALRLYPEDQPYMVMGDNTKLLGHWTMRLQTGLYGNPATGQIGWLQKLQGQRQIRIRGPRLGDNVSGGGFYTRRGWSW